MGYWKSLRSLQIGVGSALLMAPAFVAHADGLCSDQALKDFFIQGGDHVLEDSHLTIIALSQDQLIAQSEAALTCRYLMELSDHSQRWVRFTYAQDPTGQVAIDYEEEAKSTAR